jgi:hypothetical protein
MAQFQTSRSGQTGRATVAAVPGRLRSGIETAAFGLALLFSAAIVFGLVG